MIKRLAFVNGGRFHQVKRDTCTNAERKKRKFPTEWGEYADSNTYHLNDIKMIQNERDSCLIKVTVVNELGLHARSAAKLAKIAQKAKSRVWIKKNEQQVDAKSIIDILTLGCKKGSQIEVMIDDKKDIDILNSIKDMIDSGFGE